jgi:hypothetical protein
MAASRKRIAFRRVRPITIPFDRRVPLCATRARRIRNPPQAVSLPYMAETCWRFAIERVRLINTIRPQSATLRYAGEAD